MAKRKLINVYSGKELVNLSGQQKYELRKKQEKHYLEMFRRYFSIKYKDKTQRILIGEYDGGQDDGYLTIDDNIPESNLLAQLLLYPLEIYGFDGDGHQSGRIYFNPVSKYFLKKGYETQEVEVDAIA